MKHSWHWMRTLLTLTLVLTLCGLTPAAQRGLCGICCGRNDHRRRIWHGNGG